MASATTYLSSPTTTTWQLGQADKPDQRTAVQEKQYRRLRRKLARVKARGAVTAV